MVEGNARAIALFGTSADPPTLAHGAILSQLARRFDWVAVWASDNPFKPQQTAIEHRTCMLQLAIASVNIPQANVGLHQELSSPRTWETLCRARARWGPSAALTLVVGSDLVGQIPQWYASRQLLRAVRLLVVPRPGYPMTAHDFEAIRRLGGQPEAAPFQVPAVSSTAYREQQAAGAVADPVEAYIRRHRLYACQNVAST
ncbi:MAG: nicotinate-nucleotide adenylyltransferase [Cyanobacteria bacterium QS_8_64_29]|nr:MAG: nicotinate-nucleotide adenylyltransferase [Cyanobacteria bacterium QS_8_64_29]